MATALLAAKQGYQVAAWDISEAGIERTKQQAGLFGSAIHPITCDVSQQNAVREAMAKTVQIGKPHMLVNNAGPVAIGQNASFMEMTTAANGMIFYVTTAFLETSPTEGAAIVNISSIVGANFGGGEFKFPITSELLHTAYRSVLIIYPQPQVVVGIQLQKLGL